jgi:hypothetical protein
MKKPVLMTRVGAKLLNNSRNKELEGAMKALLKTLWGLWNYDK